jgi:hypothetical protein
MVDEEKLWAKRLIYPGFLHFCCLRFPSDFERATDVAMAMRSLYEPAAWAGVRAELCFDSLFDQALRLENAGQMAPLA